MAVDGSDGYRRGPFVVPLVNVFVQVPVVEKPTINKIRGVHPFLSYSLLKIFCKFRK